MSAIPPDADARELLKVWAQLREADRAELLEIGRWFAEATFYGGPYDGSPLPVEWKDELCCTRPDSHAFDCGALYKLGPDGRYAFAGGAE